MVSLIAIIDSLEHLGEDVRPLIGEYNCFIHRRLQNNISLRFFTIFFNISMNSIFLAFGYKYYINIPNIVVIVVNSGFFLMAFWKIHKTKRDVRKQMCKMGSKRNSKLKKDENE